MLFRSPATARPPRPALAGAGGTGQPESRHRASGKSRKGDIHVNRFRQPSVRLLYLAIGIFIAALLWMNRDLLTDLPTFK